MPRTKSKRAKRAASAPNKRVKTAARGGAKRPVKRAKAAAVPAGKGSEAAKAEADLRLQFVSLVMRIGTEEAERLLARIIEVETHTADSLDRISR